MTLPKRPQEAPKRPPRGPREAPKMPPNSPQQAPKRAPRGLGFASRRPPRDLPRHPNELSRCFHEGPQTPPGQFQKRSRASQDRSTTTLDGASLRASLGLLSGRSWDLLGLPFGVLLGPPWGARALFVQHLLWNRLCSVHVLRTSTHSPHVRTICG